jgi:HSP20 family protein
MVTMRRPEQPYMPLRDAMKELFAEAFSPMAHAGAGVHNGQDSLPMNVYEDGERFYLHLLAPGIDPEASEITAANGVLSVAVRQKPLNEEAWRAVWQEFAPTEYRRQVRLPIEFDANRIEASYQGGVLMLTVPKAEHTKPKTIKVQVAG